MLNLLNPTVLIFALGALLTLLLAAGVWIASHRRRAARADRVAVLVTPEEAEAPAYPYIFVTDVGAARELHACEKELLETAFRARDPSRPYVKAFYGQTNRRGTLSGYCRRCVVPRGVRIGYPPIELPVPARSGETAGRNRAAAELNGVARRHEAVTTRQEHPSVG